MLMGSPAVGQTGDQSASPSKPGATAPASSSSTQSSSAIVITGYRKAYADAVVEKRKDIEVSDGISREGLEKLPDLNLGEALQRLPGVQINRNEEGRDATLSVRGLPGEFSLPTINGVIYATPIVLSSNPFGAYPADIFNGVRIEKTPMADVQAGAIAGRIDMQIGGALKASDELTLRGSYEYDQLGKYGSPGASMRWNHHFTDNLAVSLNLYYSADKFRRDELNFTAYNTLSPTNTPNFNALYAGYYASSCAGSTARFCTATPAGTGAKGTTGILYLSQPRQYVRVNQGKTIAGSGSIDYQATSNLRLSLSGFYTDRDLNGTAQYYAVTTLNGTGTTIIPQSDPVQLADGRWIVHDIAFKNPDVWMSTRDYTTLARSGAAFATADWHPGHWAIALTGSHSESNAHFYETQYDFETLNVASTPLNGAGNGITGVVSDGAGDLSKIVNTLTPAPGQSSLVFAQPASGPWHWGGTNNPTVYYDGTTAANSSRSLRLTGSPGIGRNKVDALKLSVQRPLNDAFTVAVGYDYSKVSFQSQSYRTSAYGAQVDNLTSAQIDASPFMSSFFGGEAPNLLTNWVVSDPSYKQVIKPISVYPGGQLSPVGFNIYYADGAYAKYNFTYGNMINAGYAQGKWDTSIFGMHVRGNAGIRYEAFRADTDALTRLHISNSGLGAPSDYQLESFKSKHAYWLPSAIIVADLTRKLTLRLAGYRSYAQPLIRQNSPVTIVGTPTVNAAGDTSVSLALGNPDLHAYTADSQDISLEWYNRPGSIISFAFYRKVLKGFIAPITDRSEVCPTDGSPWGLGTLTYDPVTNRCLSSLGTAPNVFVVNASGFKNYDQPIHVSGYEVNIQQNFDFLPKPFDKLGTVVNFNHTKASGTINGNHIAVAGVAPNSLNWIAYYETKRWGVRATYSWRDSYVPNTYYTAGSANRTVAARSQLDLSATVRLTNRVSLQASAFNITNARVYQYEDQPELPRILDYDGRTYTLTFKATI
jgi:TonB-dependent receptor